MNIAQELSIVKDNIAEYGMTNITQLEYDAIYEQGRRDAEKELNALGECEYRKGGADAIEELLKKLCIGCAYLKGTKCEIKGGCPCSIGQSEIIRSANKVLEQLKEQKNE